MPVAGLLDRDTLSGAVRFHLEAKEQGIRAIIGAEITMEDGSLLPLIPHNMMGYKNLCRLISTIKLRNKKNEHFARKADIEEFAEGLTCITGGTDGFLHRSIRNNSAKEDIDWLKFVFGGRLFIELQRHLLKDEEYINQILIDLSNRHKIPYFASNGAYYAAQRDRELFDIMTCIRNHTTLDEAGLLLSANSERYLRSESQMLALFDAYPEAVHRAGELADSLNFSLDELSYQFPDYKVAQGETMDGFLRLKAEEGAGWRYGEITPRVREKLDHELRLIEKLKMAGYFLVTWDIAEFCRRSRTLCQGRGSAANSVVCYSLGITAVDPIAADLLFERFLSEERGEFPDIDIDLPSGEDRERVIQYVYEKYGARGAGMTSVVISYRDKSAVREVGKAFGFDESEFGYLSEIIPHHGFQNEEEREEHFREAGFSSDESFRVAKFTDLYKRILDYPRHLGQHPGGMIISPGRLDSIVPLEPATMENRNIIQFDKDDCERLGIVKIDLLGLGMMAVLRDTLILIKEHYHQDIDLGQLPADDPLVYQTLQNADTIAMFQVESRAQINFLPKAKPKNFYDLVVQVAIIRPGPITGKMLQGYLKRRQGLETIDYMHSTLEPILHRTLGVPLFQEQLLRMVVAVAGFTPGEAEELRRALGFKRANKRLAKIEKRMREGMTQNNIDHETQNRIVSSVIAFANYGFPESHAASFALLTYASAYLKVHFLDAFTAAIMNNYPLGFYSLATVVKDAERHGLKFRGLDINKSDYFCTLEPDKNRFALRLGLKLIKGLRKEVAKSIVEERERKGLYIGIEDLAERVPLLNRKELRVLSESGALSLNHTLHRRDALWQAELASRSPGKIFDRSADLQEISQVFKPMTTFETMAADFNTTGLTLGAHPVSFFRMELRRQGILSAVETFELSRRDIVSVAGIVIVRQRPSTANNVVFITLEDETGHSNFIVMPDVYHQFRKVILAKTGFLLIRGIYEGHRLIKGLYFKRIFDDFKSGIGSHDFH